MKSSLDNKRAGAKPADNNGGPTDTVAPPPSLPAVPVRTATTTRNEKGQFLPGASGNPKGKPKGAKNYLTKLRRDTEIAMRDYLSTPENQDLAFKAFDRLFKICLYGEEKNAVGALKLLTDKLMVSPRQEEELETGPREINIQIVNRTAEFDDELGPVRVVNLSEEDYEEK
jgi:hypothetical protein